MARGGSTEPGCSFSLSLPPEQRGLLSPTTFTFVLGECKNPRMLQKEAKSPFQREGRGRNQVVRKQSPSGRAKQEDVSPVEVVVGMGLLSSDQSCLGLCP